MANAILRRNWMLPVLCVVTGAGSVARGDIHGFGDYSEFAFNQSDASSAPTVGNNVVHLTGAVSGEVRSVFDTVPQDITHFTASYGFRAVGTPSNATSFGACLVIQNNGIHTVATNDEGIQGTFGYNDWKGVFNRGAGISLEYGSQAANSSATAVYTGGVVGGGSTLADPVHLFSGHLIDVTLTYNGSILHENLLDTVTSDSFDNFYVINIPSIVGGNTAFVGFTANTTNTSGAMDFSNVQFLAPEPSCIAFMVLAGPVVLLRRRRG